MASRERIPLRDEQQAVGVGRGLDAILSEIRAMLEGVAAGAGSGQIDVRSLPLAPDEYERLKALLGKGEAKIELALNGLTRCEETSIPAVWWVEHLNPGGSTDAEFIEVARVPGIVFCEEGEIREGIARLRSLLEVGGSKQEELDDE